MDAIVGDRFRLLHRLGEGGTSVVWAAESVEDGAPVAVKVGRPGTVLARLEGEAAAARAVGGPHVVRGLATGQLPDGRPWFAMERLVGRDLGSAVRQDGPLAPPALLGVLHPIAVTLRAAHGRGIVHRDLKPENVFLQARSEEPDAVKLLDFGTEGVVGSPPYLAPEQARRLPRITPAADVWAFGMTALAALTGDTYWAGSTAPERTTSLLTQEMYRPRTRWPWLPAGFDAWFLHACVRDPEGRFGDMVEAFVALEHALFDASTPAPAPSRLPVARTWTEDPAQGRIDRVAVGRSVDLVGRDRELDTLRRWLLDEPSRAVTVVGPGGAGKSSLVGALVGRLRTEFTDGVCHVALGPVRAADGVWRAIAEALGPAAAGAGSEQDRVLRALAPRRLLLSLDNAEHLPTAGEVAARLIASCPALVLLVTSRSPLGLPEERRFVLEPLSVPAEDAPAEVALASPAVALFVRLASKARPSFVLGPDNLPLVCAIVRRVDGLPLALELAAARLRRFSLEDLASQLERSLSLLSGDGWRPERHQTLRSALHWSFELLPAPARGLYEEISLFVGGFERSAVEQVCVERADALPVLVDHSLVQARGDRFAMLETIRDYAGERLGARRDRAEVVTRWIGWAVELAESIERAQDTPEGEAWLLRADAEHPNLRAALEAAIEAGDATGATRIVGALAWFWYLRGHTLEGSAWVDRVLQLSAEVPRGFRAKAMATAGRLSLLRCEYARARRLSEAAAAELRELGDEAGEGRAIEVLGSVAREQGRCAEAMALHAGCASAAAARGARSAWARATNYLAFAAWLDGAPVPETSALEVFREVGDAEGITWALLNRAGAALHRDLPAAVLNATDALATARAARFREGVAWAQDLLGVAALRGGEPGAAELLRESLSTHAALGDLWRAASVLEALAQALGPAEPERAARLLGAAEGLRARIEAPVPRVERPAYEASVEALAAALGPAFGVARATGARLGLERALALARG